VAFKSLHRHQIPSGRRSIVSVGGAWSASSFSSYVSRLLTLSPYCSRVFAQIPAITVDELKKLRERGEIFVLLDGRDDIYC
jgi:hypothetical protein